MLASQAARIKEAVGTGGGQASIPHTNNETDPDGYFSDGVGERRSNQPVPTAALRIPVRGPL